MAGEPTVYVPPMQGGGAVDDFDPLRFVSTIQQLKMQKQQGARDALKQMTELAERGVLGPEAAPQMEKMFKEAFPEMQGKSGAPQATTPGGGAQPLPDTVTPQAVSSVGKAMGGPESGAQAGRPVSQQAAQKNPAGGKTQDPMAPGTGQFEQFLTQAREKSRMMNLTQNQQMQFQQIMTKKQIDATNGDQQAVGFLQRMGMIPFDPQFELWQNEDVRKAQFDRALGRETADEKEKRIQSAAQDAVIKGKFSTIADARDFFENAGSTVKPLMGAEDFMRQAQSLRDMLDAGVPASAAIQAARAAGTGANPWDMVPGDFKPLAQQALDLQKDQLTAQKEQDERRTRVAEAGLDVDRERLDIERDKLDIDIAQSKAMANKVLLELDQERNKALKEKLDFLVNATYRGVTLPEGMHEAMINELAGSLGSRLQENTGMVRRAIRWLTSVPGMPGFLHPSKTYEVVPNPSVNDTLAIQEGIGAAQPGAEAPVQPITSRSVGSVSPGFRRATRP